MCLCNQVSVLAQAAITKYHTRGDLRSLRSRNMFSHSAGGWKSKVRVSAGWCVQGLSPGLAGGPCSLCPHAACSPWAHPWCGVSLFSSGRQPCRIRAPPLPPPLTFIIPCRCDLQTQSQWGLGFSLITLGETQFSP